MKKIIILSNILLASSLVTGTTNDLFLLNNALPAIQEVVINNNTQENISFTIIKERNASVAKAEKKAKEDAALKAQQEVVQNNKENNITSNNVNNVTSNNVNKVTRNNTITVRGITVVISNSVSDSDYNTFINWIKNMPDVLLQYVETISVVDYIENYASVSANAYGVTINNGRDIYITANNLGSRISTLYHEAGHSLDLAGGYSYRFSGTSTWKNICASEWSNEGYYSSTTESFAEAVSRYYLNELGNKSRSRKAIEQILTTGKLEEESVFTEINITLYAKDKNVQIVDLPDRKATTQLGTIKPYESIEAIGVNQNGTYYKVIYNGQVGYVNASNVTTD